MKFLKDREDEKIRKKREQMRKVAPGWEPEEEGDGKSGKRHSAILQPTRKAQTQASPTTMAIETAKEKDSTPTEPDKPRDVMDDLVEGLAKMDELESSKSAN